MCEDSKSNVTELNNCLPGRKVQIDSLLKLFGEKDQFTCQSLFLYGQPSTGKTCVIRSILNYLKAPAAYVNCVECYTNNLVYQLVLNQISGEGPSADNNYTNYVNCDNMNDFVRHFKTIVTENEYSDQTVYIVLDNVERLLSTDTHILATFLRLQELTRLNVCTILISQIIWDKFRTGTGFFEPILMHFPDYSQADLADILCLTAPTDVPAEFYRNYVDLVLSVFYHVCRDLTELKLMVSIHYPKYRAPIDAGEAKFSDHNKLWRNIKPVLQKALSTVYMRDVSSGKWSEIILECEEKPDGGSSLIKGAELVNPADLDLSWFSKYLLIAAYLASYNPAKSDKRFFVKNCGKMSKRAKIARKKETPSNQLLGPKPFPLDRLLAIFYSIVDDNVPHTSAILSQIGSLVTLRLISLIGNDSRLDQCKYKCSVSLEFIRAIGRTVQFDVVKYLYDFL